MFSLAGPGLGTVSCRPQRESRICWLRPSHSVLSDITPSPLTLDRFPATASAIPPEATAPRSAVPYSQRASALDIPPPAGASRSEHVDTWLPLRPRRG